VRRSSDNAEQDIGFANNVLDTASLLSFCGAGNGFVTTWYDQVGSNNATQTTTTQQPRIVNSGSLDVNEFSKPGVRFIDTSSVAIEHLLNFSNWYAANQSYVGYFSVYSMAANGDFPSLIGSNPNNRGFYPLHNGTTREVRTATLRTTTSAADGSVINLNQTYVRHDVANRSTVRTFLDKGSTADINIADSNTDFNMPTNFMIGNSNAALLLSNFLISEIIGFTVDQDSNQLAIRTNQFDFWRS
jgi:hypothetical protein